MTAAPAPAPAPAAPSVVPTAPAARQIHTAQASGPVSTVRGSGFPPAGKPLKKQKKKLGNGAKGAIAAVLGILVLLLAWLFLNHLKQSKITGRYNELVKAASDISIKELPIDARDLGILLDSVRSVGTNADRETVYRALFIARPTDGTDIDGKIFELATSANVHRDIRNALISRIVGPRRNPAMAEKLIAYAKSAPDTSAAKAALDAVVSIGGDEQFPDLINIIQSSPSVEVRRAAEQSAGQILLKTARRVASANDLAEAYAKAPSEESRHAFLRLLGLIGGAKASAIVTEALEKGSEPDKLAAVLALGQWPDASMFGPMMDFLAKTGAGNVRNRTHEQALRFLVEHNGSEDNWKRLAANAKTNAEQDRIIRSLAARRHEPWAIAIVEGFAAASDNDSLIDLAEKAVDAMKERAKVAEGQEGEEE